MHLLDMTYSKIFENVILVGFFFNFMLSALGVIMFHKGSIIIYRKNHAFISS